MTDALKNLAIAFQDKELLAEHYQKLKGIFLTSSAIKDHAMILDLDSLPTTPLDYKMTFILWMISVNMPRIKAGEQPIMTLPLALKCPIWQTIKPPLVNLKMTPEKMFNKPSIKTLGKKASPKTINRR